MCFLCFLWYSLAIYHAFFCLFLLQWSMTTRAKARLEKLRYVTSRHDAALLSTFLFCSVVRVRACACMRVFVVSLFICVVRVVRVVSVLWSSLVALGWDGWSGLGWAVLCCDFLGLACLGALVWALCIVKRRGGSSARCISLDGVGADWTGLGELEERLVSSVGSD